MYNGNWLLLLPAAVASAFVVFVAAVDAYIFSSLNHILGSNGRAHLQCER